MTGSDVFARAFDEAAAAVDAHLRLPLREVMWGARPGVVAQHRVCPAGVVRRSEIALAALWQSCGVAPDVVMGHSVGEITAAYVAGVLSLTDAARMVAARGRLMAGLPAGGVMVAVGAGEAEVAALLNDGVSIAAVNGPNAVVLSGAQAPVEALADRLAQAGPAGASAGGVARVSFAADAAHGGGIFRGGGRHRGAGRRELGWCPT